MEPRSLAIGEYRAPYLSKQEACVEAAVFPAGGGYEIRVRDSKNPDGPVLTFTPREWAAFTGSAADGDLSLPPGVSGGD